MASATFQALFALPIAGGGGTPALVAHIGASLDANGGTTGPIDTTGATFLVCIMSTAASSGTGTVSDSNGNTWVINRYGDGVSGPDCLIAACFSPTVGTGHTFSYTSGSVIIAAICVSAFSGITASAFDANAGNTNGVVTNSNPGSITPTVAHTLVMTGLSFSNNSGGAVTVDSGYTQTDAVPYFAGGKANLGCSSAYLVLTSASAQNPTWNVTNATYCTPVIAAFAY